MTDLGAWATEEYRVPATGDKMPPGEELPEDDV